MKQVFQALENRLSRTLHPERKETYENIAGGLMFNCGLCWWHFLNYDSGRPCLSQQSHSSLLSWGGRNQTSGMVKWWEFTRQDTKNNRDLELCIRTRLKVAAIRSRHLRRSSSVVPSPHCSLATRFSTHLLSHATYTWASPYIKWEVGKMICHFCYSKLLITGHPELLEIG